jgi:hypothetical protein
MIAIHHVPGSFSDKWILYCERNNVVYEIVDIFILSIETILKKYRGLMWNWDLNDDSSMLVSKDIIYALDTIDFPIFPNFKTCFFYENKILQKYIFDAHAIPAPKTYVQFDKKKSLNFISKYSFPIVYKLKTGAGSHNVKLLYNEKEAKNFIYRLFKKGINPINFKERSKDRLSALKKKKNIRTLLSFIKSLINIVLKIKPLEYKLRNREIGYFYTQEYINNNEYDDRLVIIGNRCYCLRRYCRRDDFRASGSGNFEFNHNIFPKESIQICFDAASKLMTQCVAFDVIYKDSTPLIVEMSYSFSSGYPYNNCDGYFDKDLKWHKLLILPENAMIIDFLKKIEV